ncbi:uncharacterized protein MAM_04412 [Metarhizium album ARSEF 1941]|uniref:ER-bound oxygenase mpaB/mpaB'/Rubber oxygenase catalytic domain-containing protein n=1 Tax=Metarhizium album (strain ARSEF 1941) TaxID=1081103 RepID=A0A0B2WVC3_METAS|nr:uncharacterized protein MAM_04412 [Metarhizium album ARSEF 1941]KHN98023.1 hypothetical protein MAM_04412 [Metarhizium album ARSEF 1941]
MESTSSRISKSASVSSWIGHGGTPGAGIDGLSSLGRLVDGPLLVYITLALAYPVLCALLRFQRLKAMREKVGLTDRESMSKMETAQAQYIIQQLVEWEFPFVFEKSLQFALFKTYGIPTISTLLVATRVFSSPETASKRYEDTAVLIGEFMTHRPDEERTRQAIGRMNSLHSPYIQAGKISNQDLLYTLSVFVTEPISWINRYEWRQLTDVEMCALGTFWKSIGNAMNIQYACHLRRDSWRDGIEFCEDITEWASQYESQHMVPAAASKRTATELFSLLLYHVPDLCKPFALQLIGVLMGDCLRKAMMHPAPSPAAFIIVNGGFSLRRFVLRHLALPRLAPRRSFSEKDPKSGRYHRLQYLVHPYYVEPTVRSRWGVSAWLIWALGGILPGGKGGARYVPQGYLLSDIGPDKQTPFGQDELRAWERKVEESMPLGCPFAI